MTTSKTTLTRSVPLGKDSGRFFEVPLHELLPQGVIDTAVAAGDAKATLLRELLLVGTSRIFVDVQASAKTDAERLASCNKKLDAWREGEMNVRGGGGGGETVEGEVKRLLVAAYMEATGESESKALLRFKGRGFEVLAGIAAKKAEALVSMPSELGNDAPKEARVEHAKALDAAINARAAKASELLEASKADWSARATESLKAKAEAREASEGFDVTDLI